MQAIEIVAASRFLLRLADGTHGHDHDARAAKACAVGLQPGWQAGDLRQDGGGQGQACEDGGEGRPAKALWLRAMASQRRSVCLHGRVGAGASHAADMQRVGVVRGWEAFAVAALKKVV